MLKVLILRFELFRVILRFIYSRIFDVSVVIIVTHFSLLFAHKNFSVRNIPMKHSLDVKLNSNGS